MERMSNKLVIGLTGEKLAGKHEFTRVLTSLATSDNHTVGIEVFSGILRDTLNIWTLRQSRTNLQKLAATMRDTFGPAVLSDANFHRVLKRDEDIIILDGARSVTDRDLIRRFPNNLLVYITAPVRLRWERSLDRDQNVGEKDTSLEQFLEEEKDLSEMEIPLVGDGADYKIVNGNSLDDYQASVREFYQKFVIPKL